MYKNIIRNNKMSIKEISYKNDFMAFEIFGTEVGGLSLGKEASGLPKKSSTLLTKENHCFLKIDLHTNISKRSKKLAQAKAGSGHDCWLKSATVWAYCCAAQSWIQQLSRYTSSMEFVSSQSTMVLVKECPSAELSNALHELCFGAGIDAKREAYQAIARYRETRQPEHFQRAIALLPECTLGFCFKINYMTLKTIYNQRKNHDRKEWRLFIEWMLSLPEFKDLVLGE